MKINKFLKIYKKNPDFKPRAESFDSITSPHPAIKDHVEINNVSDFIKECKIKKIDFEPKNGTQKKKEFMRNLAPIERPKTTVYGNSVQLSTNGIVCSVSE